MFRRLCPLYMAMGMSHTEFWDGDPWLARDYRKAYEYRKEAENEMLWLGGLYTAQAVASVLMGKKAKYPDRPHLLDTSISRERKRREQELNELKTIDYLNTWAEQWNRKFAKKQQREQQEQSNDGNAEGGDGANG